MLGLFSKKTRKIEVPLPPNPVQIESRHSDYLDIAPQNLSKVVSSTTQITPAEQKNENPFRLEQVEAPKLEVKIGEEAEEQKESGDIKNIEAPEELPELDISSEIGKIESEISGPLHVQIDDYKEIIESMAKIKDELIEADGILSRLEEIKTQKDFVSNNLRDSFEDVERKLTYLDNKIFEGV